MSNMNDAYYMLKLLSLSVTEKAAEYDKAVNYETVCKLANMHKVTCTIYPAIAKNADSFSELLPRLEAEQLKAVALDTMQRHDYDIIRSAFEGAGVRYMPMKGIEIKKIYPQSYMRSMSDIDILIDENSFEAAKAALEAQGFINVKSDDGNCRDFNKPPFTHIELHFSPVSRVIADIHDYYGNGWRLAKKDCNNSFGYHLSESDLFIHTFLHLVKHYKTSGIGIRFFLDIYVIYNKKRDALDMEYIKKELQSLSLWEFFCHTLKFCNMCFGEAEHTPLYEDMARYVLSCGVYGTLENTIVNEAVKTSIKDGVKTSAMAQLLFPNREYMERRYPWLKKHKNFLPALWLVRICDTALFRRKYISKKYKLSSSVDKEQAEKLKEMHKKTGLFKKTDK